MKKMFISKKNLLHNLKVIKAKTNAKVLAVVKANAYAHGLEPICKILFEKVEYFGVATIEEALQVRSFDTTTKVLILGHCSDFVMASKHNISVSIFSLIQAQKLCKSLKKINKINIHLKVDTGMNRLGFTTISDFLKALKLFKKYSSKIVIEGLFTHFATLRNDLEYFKKQQAKFERFKKHIKDTVTVHTGGSLVSNHANNYDMLRFGIYLYGYGLKELRPVMSVKAKPISIKNIAKGQNVGYSKSYITNQNCTVAVLPIGYHDGVPRNFIGNHLQHKKEKIEILSVCMDMTIVKVPENFKESNQITVFNNASNWAKYLKTNEHDVLVKFNSFRGKKIVK